MKVAQFSLPLSALLVIGLNQSALAGPQSLLDPYATIKAPVRKTPAAVKKPVAPQREMPTSVTIGGGAAAPLPVIKKTEAPKVVTPKTEKPKAVSAITNESSEEGFIAGTKQIFRGFATATKGAVAAPTRLVTSGVSGMVAGTKKVGGSVADGAKSSGGFVANGAKAVGGGFLSVGGKLKDGTVAVGEKVKDGAGAAGHAIVAVPKAVGGGVKATGEKIADGTGDVGSKLKEGGGSVGGKIVAVPKAVGKGIVGAAAKTGEATKKVAGAPLGLFGKLNPFRHKEQPGVATAAKPDAPATK